MNEVEQSESRQGRVRRLARVGEYGPDQLVVAWYGPAPGKPEEFYIRLPRAKHGSGPLAREELHELITAAQQLLDDVGS